MLIPILRIKTIDARKDVQHSVRTLSGVYHPEITESEAALKRLLRQQKSARDKAPVHLLYLLKSGRAATMPEAAAGLADIE